VITTLPVVVAPESVAPDSRPMGRLEFIDGLRGTAVVMVILAHFYPRAYSFGLPRWADCFSLGYLGVHLFLLLSGFCVAWAYLGSPPRPFSVADFAKRRALRILPAYYVALLISAALAAPDYGAVEFARQLLVHAVMLHNLSPSTALAFNPPFWSLALECQLYVCFPLMLLAYRRYGIASCLATVFALQTAFRVYALRYGTEFNSTLVVVPWSVAGRLSEFALGLAAAIVVSNARLASLPVTVRALLPLGVPVLFACALFSKSRLGTSHPLTDVLWSLGFFLLLLGASLPGALLNRVLSQPRLVRLGIFSYSVYLVHELVLGRLMTPLLPLPLFRGHPLLLLPVVFVLAIASGYAFYRLVERPAIKLFAARRMTAAQSSSPT